MDTKVVVCACRRTYRFYRPKMGPDEIVVVTGLCSCGKPVTHTWRPPSRWSLLEVD